MVSTQLALVVCLMFASLQAKPVTRKLNFNLFLLTPKNSTNGNTPIERDSEKPDYVKSPVKVLFSTNGLSRFPPILEYIVQRIQGMFSVYVKDGPSGAGGPALLTNGDLQLLASSAANVTGVSQPPDTAENEVVQVQELEPVAAIHGVDGITGLPNVVVKPSSLHPGTYEVEISVATDDGQPTAGDD